MASIKQLRKYAFSSYEAQWINAFTVAARFLQFGDYYGAGPRDRWPTPWRVSVERTP